MTSMSEDVYVREIKTADVEAVAKIYNHYVTETIVTFEEEPVSSSEICQRIKDAQFAKLPWLIAEQAGEIIGYAYASKWKGRCAYRFSTEVTVYLKPDHEGHGVGSKLYDQLLTMLRSLKIHVAIGGIALPNEVSISFHEKFGFTKIAHFKEVGFKFNRWIDVGYWQCIL